MEQVPDSFPSLFIGYVVIWSIISLYIISLGARLRRVERELSKTPVPSDSTASSQPQ